MGVTISFGIQKGGVGKTTVTALSSFLLSLESKVLAVDFDSQGNLTQFLTQQNIYDFTRRTVLEAVKEIYFERYPPFPPASHHAYISVISRISLLAYDFCGVHIPYRGFAISFVDLQFPLENVAART